MPLLPLLQRALEPRRALRTWREGLEREAAAVAGGRPAFRHPLPRRRHAVPSSGPTTSPAVGGPGRGPASPWTRPSSPLEANPSGGADRLSPGWRDAGVTRLSVGVQSFDDGVLRTLGRGYTAAEALRFCRAAREAGFDVSGRST
ncbi:MAG: radical SAM protein [Comamonadaceae bacterium]|nr:radical SAM protein [Comamonadaceae bacterium]